MRLSNQTIVTALFMMMVVALVQCSSSTKDKSDTDSVAPVQFPVFSADDVAKGKALAATYCKACHQLPDPSLLSKIVWQRHVLPVMGLYLGVKGAAAPQMLNSPDINRDYVPTTPAMPFEQWRQIAGYYITKAPEHLPPFNRAEPIHEMPFFKMEPAQGSYVSSRALTSYVKIDESVTPHRLIVFDGLNNKLNILNDKAQTINAFNLSSAVVNMLFQNDGILTTTIGLDLHANDERNGGITKLNIDAKGEVSAKEGPLMQGLARPLSVDVADFDMDGEPDFLVAQFGKMAGKLSWFSKLGTKFNEHVLRNKPGCLKIIIDDSGTGKSPNIWALFGQGDEGVFLYSNDGKGNFNEKRLLSFPPSYGSISFDLVDFNGDGFKDIIYACGDNADYSQITKPYHGVYIYLNDGKNNFTQKYFYMIHGCNKVIAKDFDGDGDLDIAAISEYPTVKSPWEAFMYLENKGNFNFQAYTLPLDAPFKRGMTMDAGDIDGDGKIDILLGAGFATFSPKDPEKEPLFIVLKNITGKK